MKTKSVITLTLLLLASVCFAQTEETISFKFKNSSFLVKKLILISYEPDQPGNGTQAFWMLPRATKSFRFKPGTKLYLANQRQVNVVMSGERIDSEKPFLVVSKELANKSVNF